MDQKISGFLKNHKDRIYNTEGFFDISLTYSITICRKICLVQRTQTFKLIKKIFSQIEIEYVKEISKKSAIL